MSRAIMGKLLNVLVYLIPFVLFLSVPSVRAFRFSVHLVGWLLCLPLIGALTFGSAYFDGFMRGIFGEKVTAHFAYQAFSKLLGTLTIGCAFALGTIYLPGYFATSSVSTLIFIFAAFGVTFAAQEAIDARFK